MWICEQQQQQQIKQRNSEKQETKEWRTATQLLTRALGAKQWTLASRMRRALQQYLEGRIDETALSLQSVRTSKALLRCTAIPSGNKEIEEYEREIIRLNAL